MIAIIIVDILTLVWDWSNSNWFAAATRDKVSLTWLSGLTLEADLLASGLGGSFGGGVLLHATKEIVTALGVADVLNANVDALLDVAVADALVDDDANCRFGHIIDNTSATSNSSKSKHNNYQLKCNNIHINISNYNHYCLYKQYADIYAAKY